LRILRFTLVSMLVLYFSLYYVNASGVVFMVTTTHGPVQPIVVGVLAVANSALACCSLSEVCTW
jgi:hypothetical protein